MDREWKKSAYSAALLILLLFHVLNNFYFLTLYPLAEGKDSLSHLTAFLNFSHIFHDGASSAFYNPARSWLGNLIFGVIDYPPFFYASAFWFKTLFGAILPNAALYAGTVFLVILLASVYKIGSYWGKENGLLAAFICGMYPMIFWTSRHFSLELPLAAMTALSIRYLLKTDLFRSRKYAVVLGIVMGVGMLTKQTFGVYVCGPFTVVLVRMFREFRGPERNLRMGNAGLCLLLTLLISLIYYHEPEVFRNILVRSGFSGAVAEKSIFNPAHLFYYPWTLRNTIGVFFTAVLLWAFMLAVRIRKDLLILTAAWGVIPLVVFTAVRLKYGEYTVAYLPALALLSAAGIRATRPDAAKKILIALVVVFSAVNFYSLTFARAAMFYSTYHATNPRVAFRGDRFVSYSGDDLVARVERNSKRIGIFYDELGLDFPVYFTRSIFAAGGRKAEIVDFYFRPDIFFKNMARFDTMIFVSRTGRRWFDAPNFHKFIDTYNNAGFWPLDVPEETIARLIDREKGMIPVYTAEFFTGTTGDSKENVCIYMRRGNGE